MSILFASLKDIFARMTSQGEIDRSQGTSPPTPQSGEDAAWTNAYIMTGRQPPGAGAGGNPLLDYFMRNRGRIIHKWVDYFEIYHRTLERFRGKPIKFLEVGVQNGGSTRMWRNYFGPEATIIGVDIDPRCKVLEEEGFEIWIGDQADPAFWEEFCRAQPQLDVVLDDGGHTMAQQIATFNALFPRVSDGGVYVCEDTHSSYISAYGGGLGKPGTFQEYVKGLIDEMHAWYYAPLGELTGSAYMAKNLYCISIFDSIVVMEKRRRHPPLALARGEDGHAESPSAMTYLDLRHLVNVPDSH